MQKILEGASGEEAANIIYSNDLENMLRVAEVEEGLSTVISGIGTAILGVPPAPDILVYNVPNAGTYPLYGGLVVSPADVAAGLVQFVKTGGVWEKRSISVSGQLPPIKSTDLNAGGAVGKMLRNGNVISNILGLDGEPITANKTTDLIGADDKLYFMVGAEKFKRQLNGAINVRWFGAKGDGVTDDTLAFNLAQDYGMKLIVPAGTYLLNADIHAQIVIEGEGSERSILKPFDITKAALTYHPFISWSYNSEIRNIGFLGTARTGVGFAFSRTVFADYQVNDEYAGNVKFYGCRFKELNKGIQFTYGNIGCEIYSCGFNSCKYGMYSISNKFGGIMHAGGKYIYGGQIDDCDVGIYIHNTASGMGGFSVTDTIIEHNKIGVYSYSGNTYAGPISFINVWNEGNGAATFSGVVLVDKWDGTARTEVEFAPRAFIFDGLNSNYTFRGGLFAGVQVLATQTKVIVDGAQVEREFGFGGAPSDAVDTSEIIFSKCQTYGGFPIGENITLIDCDTTLKNIDNSAQGAQSRGRLMPHKLISQALNCTKVSMPLSTAASLGAGTFNVDGDLVSDGIRLATCNEFVCGFSGPSQYIRLIGSSLAIDEDEYVVMTCGFKLISGSPTVFFWNRGASVGAIIDPAPVLNRWFTIGFIGKGLEATDIFLDFSDTAPTTFRLCDFQAVKFATEREAREFLNSNIFIV